MLKGLQFFLVCVTGWVLIWSQTITSRPWRNGSQTTISSLQMDKLCMQENCLRDNLRAYIFMCNWARGCCNPRVASGGYIGNMEYFRNWERYWGDDPHPGTLLRAARRSQFAPDEGALFKWCLLHYPCWIPNLWPHGPPRSLGSRPTPQNIDLRSMD